MLVLPLHSTTHVLRSEPTAETFPHAHDPLLLHALTHTHAHTSFAAGAVTANYTSVSSVTHGADGRASGAVVRDEVTGDVFAVRARAVVNAAGPWADTLRSMDTAAAETLITGSA